MTSPLLESPRADRRKSPWLLLGFLLSLATAALAAPATAPVTLVQDEASFTLSNGLITARIDKRSGAIGSLQYRGIEMLASTRGGSNGGYWSAVGRGRPGANKSAVVRIDPAKNGGVRAEVSCEFHNGTPAAAPLDVDIRYVLGQGEHWIYTYAIWSHRAGYPAFGEGEARYALKLNPGVFDYLTVDADRRRVMPTGQDWDRGTQMNLKEARRMNSGIHAGEVEHKYDYSAILSETPAYGWSSTKQHVGLWIVNPSMEYIGGGPTKVELTGHLDVNPGGLPTLLNMWLGSHYGGTSLRVDQEEAWTKVIGPFLIYCNSAPDHEAMWKDALASAARETAAWPYAWLSDPNYPPAKERATVSGQLVLRDPQAPDAQMRNLQVGLAAPDYTARGFRGPLDVDWQRDAKFYQFWTRADASGRFTIPHVRPGTYTLHAIAEGVLGEFAQAQITVAAGETKSLGQLVWVPVRYGRQLWEIGVPDRTAREFRHGDHFWQWGLYYKYPEEFPQEVNFVIGKSDWHRDWNFVQPPRIETKNVRPLSEDEESASPANPAQPAPAGARGVKPTTWSITFDLPEAPRGKATLRLAIAGSRARDGVAVAVNHTATAGTGPLPDTGVMHRDGIRGYWVERDVAFDAALLKTGTNLVQLTVPAESWVNGVLYDYLRLEVDANAKP